MAINLATTFTDDVATVWADAIDEPIRLERFACCDQYVCRCELCPDCSYWDGTGACDEHGSAVIPVKLELDDLPL